MENCLLTKLKAEINVNNPEFLGYVKIHVCNNRNEVRGINTFTGSSLSSYFPVGCKILGDGVFSTGKKIVENGDEARIPANTSFDVYVPKYTHFVKGAGLPSDSGETTISSAAIDINDFLFAFSSGAVSSLNNQSGLSFAGTYDGYKSKGNLEDIIPYFNNGVVALSLADSDIILDVNTTDLIHKVAVTTKLLFINAKGVTGSLDTYIRRFAQANKTAIESTTGNGRIAVYQSGLTSQYFDINLDSSIIPHYDSSDIITFTQGSKTVTYNIDTDTFSE